MAALTDKVILYQSQGDVGKWFDSIIVPPVMGEGERPSPLMGVRMPPRILLDPMLDFT